MPVSVKQYKYLAPVQTFSAETMWTQEATQGRQGHVGPYDTHLSHSELRPSSGQWLSRLEDLSGYVLDSISDIGDPPDVTCNDLSDDESDCEYSDEDSASSTESYNDFIRRRAQAVLAAKEAQINLKFARKRAEIEYKLIDMEKEAQLLQLKVDTMDEILFFNQTGCVKIRSIPLDLVSDTHRPKVCDTHLPAQGDTEQTTNSVEDQDKDPSVNPVAPSAEVSHVISDSKIAGLKAGSLVIINNLQSKVIHLETELYGSSTQSEDCEFIASGTLSQIQAHAIAIIENLQAKIVSLQSVLEWKKTSELNFYDKECNIPGMEMDSGCETQSTSSECVNEPPGGESAYMCEPPGGDSGPMIRPPSGGCSKHLTPSGGDHGEPRNDRMELSAPPSSECVNQPSGDECESIIQLTGGEPYCESANKVKLKHSSEHGSVRDLRQCRSDLLRLL